MRLKWTCRALKQLAEAQNYIVEDNPEKGEKGDATLYGKLLNDGGGRRSLLPIGLGFAVRGARVCVLGAGGAAAGVICALLEADVAEVSIRNRHAQRAQTLAARLDDPRVRIAASQPTAFDLLVNATSASLTNACPNFPESAAGPKTLAYDLVYAEGPTPFMHRAAERGARVSDGWGMLVAQAAASFFLWHGIRPVTQSLCRQG